MSLLIRKEVIDMADSKAEYPAPDCLAPAAIEAKTEVAGVTKANLPVAKAFLLAMFAGAFIAFGGLFFTVFLSAGLGRPARRGRPVLLPGPGAGAGVWRRAVYR